MAQKNETGLLTLRPVAWYRGLLPEKFGLPRQSGLVPELTGRVEMAEGFREREALRGLEGFSHVWLIWGFSQNHTWSPTVRPPRLGGNTRLGVFATRSPLPPQSSRSFFSGIGKDCLGWAPGPGDMGEGGGPDGRDSHL